MAYKIQQLGIGGILDQSISLVKNHFGLLFQIMLVLWIPWILLGQFLQLSMMPALPPNPTFLDLLEAQRKIMPIVQLNAIITVFVLLPLANAAVIYAVAELYLGKSVTAVGAAMYGLRRILPLFWTTIVMSLAIMGGFILLIVPGILFALWFGLSQHVVVLEKLSGVKALSRSKKLVRPYLGTFLVLGVLIAIISWSIAIGAAYVPEPYIKAVVSTLLGAVTTMLSTATFVVYYFSCRCGVENFDLEHLAAAVEETVAAPVEALEAP